MVKKVLLLLIIIGSTSLAVAQQQSGEEVVSLSEPVEETEEYEVYGSAFEASPEVVTLNKVLQQSDSYQDSELVTAGSIKQVCQKKGCFFMLSDGKNQARITFKDYSFFIPTNSAGREVLVKGTFRVKELSEGQAKHYAEDAGENSEKIQGSQKEYSLVASSVKIMKPK